MADDLLADGKAVPMQEMSNGRQRNYADDEPFGASTDDWRESEDTQVCADGDKDEYPDYDESIIHKTILVGDSGVGKTSLLVQFEQKRFPGSFSATVGIGFSNKVVNVDGSKVKLQIWDTAGQERFRSVTHAYYRDAHALLLLYDVTNRQSFDNIRAWLSEINEYANQDVVIMLLGNKADMSSDRVVRREEGEKLAKDHGVAFMETSAKTGMNVELAFMAVAKDLRMRKTRRQGDPKFSVSDYVDSQKQKSSCCS
ncbi:ras-related protein Rab-37-like isoform X2 [Ptychodera flava]|uniref:ras-related protein Rab-37-like isoform X2 n=1 Tax=Ptychodera flava TaxID=63121 RepID=UPI00396A0840